MADAQRILDELARMRQDLTVFGTTGLEPTVEDFATRQRETVAAVKRLETQVAAIGARVAAIEGDVDTLVERITPAGPTV